MFETPIENEMDKISEELMRSIRQTLRDSAEKMSTDGYAEVIGTSCYILDRDGPAKPIDSPGNLEVEISKKIYLYTPAIRE